MSGCLDAREPARVGGEPRFCSCVRECFGKGELAVSWRNPFVLMRRNPEAQQNNRRCRDEKQECDDTQRNGEIAARFFQISGHGCEERGCRRMVAIPLPRYFAAGPSDGGEKKGTF